VVMVTQADRIVTELKSVDAQESKRCVGLGAQLQSFLDAGPARDPKTETFGHERCQGKKEGQATNRSQDIADSNERKRRR